MKYLPEINKKLEEIAMLTHQEALEWDKLIFTTISKPTSHFSESLRIQYHQECKKIEEKIELLKQELIELGHPILTKTITIDIPRDNDIKNLMDSLKEEFKGRIFCNEHPIAFSEEVFILYIECTEKDVDKIFDTILKAGISKEIAQYGVIEEIDETIIPEIKDWLDAEKILLDSGKQFTYQIVEKANIDLFRTTQSPSERTKLKDEEWIILDNNQKVELKVPKNKIERKTRKIFKN